MKNYWKFLRILAIYHNSIIILASLMSLFLLKASKFWKTFAGSPSTINPSESGLSARQHWLGNIGSLYLLKKLYFHDKIFSWICLETRLLWYSCGIPMINTKSKQQEILIKRTSIIVSILDGFVNKLFSTISYVVFLISTFIAGIQPVGVTDTNLCHNPLKFGPYQATMRHTVSIITWTKRV